MRIDCCAVAIRSMQVKVVSFKKILGGVEGKTVKCHFDIHTCPDNTIRYQITRNSSFNTVCYAIAG